MVELMQDFFSLSVWYEFFFAPFEQFFFMRRALVGTFALALGCGSIGLFLVMRRMTLIGDAMSHAVLPGVAVAYLYVGLSLPAMSLGGILAGLFVVGLSHVSSRFSVLKEDASLAAYYLMSLALGVILVTRYSSQVDLIHILFGSVLALDDVSLYFVATIASVTIFAVAVFFRPLILENIDPVFLSASGRNYKFCQLLLIVLVVFNLVAGFQALGTLMAVGFMMIPAITARLWSHSTGRILCLSIVFAVIEGYVGLLCSYHLNLPSGPSIILCAGSVYLVSLLFAPAGGILPRYLRQKHFVQ